MLTTPEEMKKRSRSNCINGSLIGANEDGSKLKIVPLYCHKWTCDHCRKLKSKKWKDIAMSGQPERFITLTLRAQKKLTAKYQARIIKDAFTKLVKDIRHDYGEMEYLMVFELTKQGTPHVHIMQRGAFIPKGWLSRKWQKYTGSFIVDIKSIRDPRDVSRYMMKYLGKALSDVARELHGMRIIQRSKKWIIPEVAKELEGDTPIDDDVLEWTFCTFRPYEVVDRATMILGYTIKDYMDGECLVLEGKPDEDIAYKIIEPLIEYR